MNFDYSRIPASSIIPASTFNPTNFDNYSQFIAHQGYLTERGYSPCRIYDKDGSSLGVGFVIEESNHVFLFDYYVRKNSGTVAIFVGTRIGDIIWVFLQ